MGKSIGLSEPTQRHQGREVLSEIPVRSLFRVSDQVAFHGRQSLGRDGTGRSIEDSVGFPVALGQESAIS